MKIKILDTGTLGYDISFSEIEKLGSVTTYKTSTHEELCERIKNADVIILNKLKITKEVLDCAENLKLICVTATGYDNIDIESCRKRNIAVCNVVGYSTHSVAQLTLSMVFALSVNLRSFQDYVISGEYESSGVANKLTPVFHELFGKTWGIVGYGNIGKQVGKVASAMGCNVIAYKRTPVDDVKCVDIKTLCEQSDIITIHTPLTSETEKLINGQMISYMKKDVIIVNTSRGKVADEEEIADALCKHRIGGFATDVYSEEPFPSDHPFQKIKDMKNVILTPHMAWGAFESRQRCIKEVAENITAFLHNEKRNRVEI